MIIYIVHRFDIESGKTVEAAFTSHAVAQEYLDSSDSDYDYNIVALELDKYALNGKLRKIK